MLPLPRPSYAFARRHGVALAENQSADSGQIDIAVRKPGKLSAVAELRRFIKQPINIQLLEPAEFEQLLERSYTHEDDAAEQVAADLGDDTDLNLLAEGLPEPADLLESEDDAPIIRLINALLTQAVKREASDIHVEPYASHLAIRYRVDGVMHEVMRPKASLAPLIVSRIKVMANLDIAEKRLPQDGRIALRVAGRPVDVRVSTLPSGHGERVVLRLLDKQAGRLDLPELGMDPDTHKQVQALIQRPHGIILVTGPTGSGKTTSLYAMLSQLNDSSRNIMTVEDPIEYYIEGIAQTQVNNKVELTFARGLRAILRQDPDVVMVGEIRDLETAEIAVQASLTGHLVLSTLHTNSAVGAITRLQDMGIEPFLLASSLIGVISQRLVRRLDPALAEPWQVGKAELQSLGIPATKDATLKRPAADQANAYRGRTGIYELVKIDQEMSQLIHNNASESELEKQARSKTESLAADGWRKAQAGTTSLEEVLRVTREA